MTLREYRLALKWSKAELARQSGLTQQTIRHIEAGKPAYDVTLARIAETLSKALERTITVDDIEGVRIIGVS